jgi:UDPglucose 6-dehydrogenase
VTPLVGSTVGVLGLAYKSGTDTLRRSTSIELIRALSDEGVIVRAYDPHVTQLPDDLGDTVSLVGDPAAVARRADALVVAGEWPDLRLLTAHDVADAMSGSIVLDPGRVLDPCFARHPKLKLFSIGRPACL